MQAGEKFAPSALTQAKESPVAGAAAQPITKLSTLIRDPFVRALFDAAERPDSFPEASRSQTPYPAQTHP